ncbi:LIC12611 family phage tail protein [Leptospira santarosai]|uniref:LIC12611 family phage tail protein n=1 Tax=Leptospira santarosai TaxID=28183 RepID=UPI0003463625|nr:tape measure protein [Leptospira santarosai]
MTGDQVLRRLSIRVDLDGVSNAKNGVLGLGQVVDNLVRQFLRLDPQISSSSESMDALSKNAASLVENFEPLNNTIPDAINATANQIQIMSKYLGIAEDELSKLMAKTKGESALSGEFERAARAAGMTDQEIQKILEHSKALRANPPIPPKVFAPTTEQMHAMSKSLGVSEDQLNKLISKTKTDFKLADEFKETAKAAGLTDREIQKISGHIEESKIKTVGWMSLMKGLVAMGLAAGLSGLFGSALDRAGQIEKYQTVLTTTLGSVEKAKAAIGDIQKFAQTTPYEMAELTGSYIKLANRGMRPTMEMMTRFGDIAASQGKSFDQFTEAALDATVGEFERMKEFGIRMSSAGGRVMIQFKDFKRSVEKTPAAIQAALLELGKIKGVQGGMEALSKTWVGLVSNLRDGFDQTIAKVGAFFAIVLKPFLEFFTDGERGSARMQFALAALAIAIGVGLVGATLAWKASLDAVAIAKIAAFGELIGIALAVAASLTAMYLVLEDIYIFFEYGSEGSETYFAELLKWFGLTDSELGDLHKGFQEFKAMLSNVWGAIAEFAKSDIGKTIGKIALIVAGVIAAIAFLPATITLALVTMATVIYTKWNQITKWISGAWDSTLKFLYKAAVLTGKLIVTGIFPLAGIFLFRDEIGQAFDWIWSKLQSIPFLKPWLDQIVNLKNQARAIFDSIMNSINEGLASFFDFDGLTRYLTKTINDMIDRINNAMTSVPLLKSVFPMIPHIEARERGGPIEAGKPYLVGEKGPELRVFGSSGSIIPNNQLSFQPAALPPASERGISFNIDRIEVHGNSSPEQATSFWSEIKRLAKENENEIRISLGLAPA